MGSLCTENALHRMEISRQKDEILALKHALVRRRSRAEPAMAAPRSQQPLQLPQLPHQVQTNLLQNRHVAALVNQLLAGKAPQRQPVPSSAQRPQSPGSRSLQPPPKTANRQLHSYLKPTRSRRMAVIYVHFSNRSSAWSARVIERLLALLLLLLPRILLT